jgi:oxaloacetate decarboxylase alpha subunit
VEKLRRLEPLSLEGARERFGAGISEEELLLRLTMPAEQVDAMVAARGSEPAVPLVRPGRDPLVRLLGELAKRDSLSYVRVEKGDDLVVWRRAA